MNNLQGIYEQFESATHCVRGLSRAVDTSADSEYRHELVKSLEEAVKSMIFAANELIDLANEEMRSFVR